MSRQLNPAAVRAFVEERMPGYYRALAQRREAEWLESLDDEIGQVSRGWTAAEIHEFVGIVDREFRRIRLEMQLAGPDAVAERFGVVLPRQSVLPALAVAGAALALLIAMVVLVIR